MKISDIRPEVYEMAERAQARSTGERHGDSIKVDGHDFSRQAAKAAFI